jgi:hypothetical protein
MSRARIAIWSLAAVLVIAAARQLAYALAGDAVAHRLAGEGGGANPVWIAAAALAACAVAAIAGVWLVAIGVRERCRLDLERWAAPAPLRPLRIAVRAGALGLATNAGFALVESCVHYEQGLGWMGLRCIRGPIHADAAPILVGLSLLAAALISAAEHVLLALRRAVALHVLARRAALRPGKLRRARPAQADGSGRPSCGANLTRGPPVMGCTA